DSRWQGCDGRPPELAQPLHKGGGPFAASRTCVLPQKADSRQLAGLLRQRGERPRGRAADERNEVAPLHCLVLPVLPTERIAHLRTLDCCIHPPGRYETMAVPPPIIFSKGGSPKQATPLPNFRGWCLDENLKPKSPPYGGGARIDVRWQDKNEVGLAARAAMLRESAAQATTRVP